MTVLLLPTPACAVAGAATALGRKRALSWHNQARNELRPSNVARWRQARSKVSCTASSAS